MIDLHSHILPGLDEGPADVEGSLDLARAAVAAGTQVMVATPHVRETSRFPLNAIAAGVESLREALEEEGIDLEVVPGAEVSISKIEDLESGTLRDLCIGESSYLLVESPYTYASGALEGELSALQAAGVQPILVHPERSPSFLTDHIRLERIVQSGVMCSVTAASMRGDFGKRARDFTARMFCDGLVHNVASDAQSAGVRPPGLLGGFEALEQDVPGIIDQLVWFTAEVPSAVLGDRRLPQRPARLTARKRGLKRLLSAPTGFSRAADGDAVR